jgi:recombination protein RecA
VARASLIKPRPVAAPEAGGSIYFSSPKENIEFIPSGCTMLDCVLGGGWPLGRISNVVGDKSTGKTLVAIEALANFLAKFGKKGHARYNESEAAFDPDYAKALGIDFDRVDMLEDCRTVEDFEKDVLAFCGKLKGEPGIYIMDSLDALSDAAEMERDVDKGSYGAAKAKKLSEFFRKQTHRLKETNVHLMVISQVRDNIGVMGFGEKHTRSGGRALDFYASQIVWLAHLKRLKRTVSKVERPVGVQIKAQARKNKVGLPFRECVFDITFGYGMEDEDASRAWLKDIGEGAKGESKSGAELRDYVIKRWFEIEKTFLPTKRKYE